MNRNKVSWIISQNKDKIEIRFLQNRKVIAIIENILPEDAKKMADQLILISEITTKWIATKLYE